MISVEFHIGANDKIRYAIRLLRKAFAAQAKVIVIAEAATLARLDEQLWVASPELFVPHCLTTAPDLVVAQTPILFTTTLENIHLIAPDHFVLVNLGLEIPIELEQSQSFAPSEQFKPFQRIIDLVAKSENEIQKGRQRWQFFKNQGCTLIKHDVKENSSD